MYKYSFVSIAIKTRREGASLEQDYHEIIRAKAELGWKFVQAIPFDALAEPRVDLVFSRKEKK